MGKHGVQADCVRSTQRSVELVFTCTSCGCRNSWLCRRDEQQEVERKIAADPRCFGCHIREENTGSALTTPTRSRRGRGKR